MVIRVLCNSKCVFKPRKNSLVKMIKKKKYDKGCKCLFREVKHAKNVFNRNVFNSLLHIKYFYTVWHESMLL